ncbi:DUF2235 domain-containing protein [Pseudoponticoccus marisrubri]|uniref:T6SS Phospholipase effector Tle1-like catalytic domain-containing protein n=1 Tax=Pseudoponticoccus marisrubri TaxID=1685382 RepID=A0A0W7WN90_9RHOB|nr:DUF2235 domain-containing protein [Pseudoponticoccus marisrubri]KUF12069.1 hypothetical protein AVJ23_05720 [Pseudoponticoccus marisrubri]
MNRSRLNDRLFGWLRRRFATGHSAYSRHRGSVDHVIILDGTMSSLKPGEETNAGLTFRLLSESGRISVFYEAGVQWKDWATTADVAMGRGINRQIRRAYGYLASRYREGDRIFLMGYSRGAYAARSLAGVIDLVGLLRASAATERNIRQIYRLYQYDPHGTAAAQFAARHCHPQAPIEMVGVWDTVKSLGLRLPLFWRLTEGEHAFHNHALGASVRHGFHALAHDETRQAYAPVLWQTPPERAGDVEQVWFRGTHGDVGGQLDGFDAARPLANIPLVWMLDKLEACDLGLPEGWRDRFPCDPEAPSIGTWAGVSKLFLLRAPRIIGTDPSERLHDTVLRRAPLPADGVPG